MSPHQALAQLPTLSDNQVRLRLPPKAARTTGPPRTRTGRCISHERIMRRGRSTPTERPTRSHARAGMTPPPATIVDTGLISREARDVLSYRYATSPAL